MASVSSLLNPSDGDNPQSTQPSPPLPPPQPAQSQTAEAADALPTSPAPPPTQWTEQDSTSHSTAPAIQGAVVSTQGQDAALSQQDALPEAALVPQLSSPPNVRRASQPDEHALKSVVSLKTEFGQHVQSPLRESSVPVPTTEDSKDELLGPSKLKRPAPARTKKGTAAAVKKEKAHPAKKRKVDAKRADTPSSRASRALPGKGTSAKGTPLNSSPAPSVRSYSVEPQEEQDDDDGDEDDEGRSQDGDLYCICRKPDHGTFMIGCDGTCDDWFHGKCVNIPERDKNFIDKYFCPTCTQGGVGETTWKRICRREGCRQPAKTSKSKPGGHVSKYCSEECGVLFFEEMAAQSRGGGDSASRRAGRNKNSVEILDKQDDHVGARGGALAAGEVKALLNVAQTAEEFRKLGDGVLSPPTTPNGTDEKGDHEFTESEVRELQRIQAEKQAARQRHTLLKDRMKFATMAKQAASRVTTERELKPKEYCGYDPRLEWPEDRFQAWRNSATGQQAFELDTLALENSGNMDDTANEDELVPDICDRKKCARHLEWSKLVVDDIRFEMSDNGDRMRLLDREEGEIKARAALRAKTESLSGGGSVELHGVPALVETGSMVVDGGNMDVVQTVEQPESMAVDAV